MDIEQEIENIVNNIYHKDITSLDEIEKIRNIVIDRAYEEFIVYDDNLQNLNEAKMELEEYEFVSDPAELQPGDEIKMPDFKHFFNMKLLDLGFTRVNSDGTIHIRQGTAYKDIQCEFVFRKLTEEDKIKISLVQAIN
jgi:hypothetical protein